MKTALSFLSILFCSIALPCLGQSRNTPVHHFTKIIASPRVNLVLQKGDQESIDLVYSNIDSAKVNVLVTGHTLRIFLDDARKWEKYETLYEDGHRHKESIYRNASVTAYVTYKELKALEVRGEQEVTCNDPLTADKIKLTLYGESEVDLVSVHAKKFKVSLYGENSLKVHSGDVDRQVYRSFGENKIDTRGLNSQTASTRIFGEGRVKLKATEKVSISAFGEPELIVEGNAHIHKGIVIGRARIRPQ